MDYSQKWVHNGGMRQYKTARALAILFTALLVLGSGGCGETDSKGDTAKESIDSYVDTLSTAQDKARDVVKDVEDKQGSYLDEVPLD